jgi:rubredoxin-NAD+ reductase
MISQDSGDYYSKPTLSNAFAQGKAPAALVLTSAEAMEKQLGITLLTHCKVNAIHRLTQQLDTSAGLLDYDRLVLAAGADPIHIPLQGNAADDVLTVNDLADYAHLRDQLEGAKTVAIMGGGLIGCEFANDLAIAGFKVHVIDPGPYPLAGLLPEQAGTQLLEPLSKMGVIWHFGSAVHSMNASDTGYALTLTDNSTLTGMAAATPNNETSMPVPLTQTLSQRERGQTSACASFTLNADLVLSAVGLRPRTQLAREAGLTVNRGIVVDDQLRSSDAAIYALGDCAEIDGRVLPFVLPIMQAGRALAKVLNGEDAKVVFPYMPVVVKTPAHPVAVSPVARDAAGAWQVLASGQGIKMGFFNPQNQMIGFSISGEFTAERNEMTKLLVTI